MSRRRSRATVVAMSAAAFLAMGHTLGCFLDIADVKGPDAGTSGDAVSGSGDGGGDSGVTPRPDGAAPPGTFACGTTYCNLSTQYCQVKTGVVSCETIPSCPGPDWCACVCPGMSTSCTTGSSGSYVTCS
jgi:hypothetical protein